MVEFNHPSISIKRQAQLLGIHRTSVYRQSKGQTESSENIMLMHEMDMLYTAHPYFGYWRMTTKLREKGFESTTLNWTIKLRSSRLNTKFGYTAY